MTITIDGNSKEVAEFMGTLLNGTESKAKKPYFPPLIKELTEDEKIKESSDEISHVLDKMNEVAKQRKENTPRTEAAERQENKVLSREEAKETIKGIDAAVSDMFKYLCHTL